MNKFGYFLNVVYNNIYQLERSSKCCEEKKQEIHITVIEAGLCCMKRELEENPELNDGFHNFMVDHYTERLWSIKRSLNNSAILD